MQIEILLQKILTNYFTQVGHVWVFMYCILYCTYVLYLVLGGHFVLGGLSEHASSAIGQSEVGVLLQQRLGLGCIDTVKLNKVSSEPQSNES